MTGWTFPNEGRLLSGQGIRHRPRKRREPRDSCLHQTFAESGRLAGPRQTVKGQGSDSVRTFGNRISESLGQRQKSRVDHGRFPAWKWSSRFERYAALSSCTVSSSNCRQCKPLIPKVNTPIFAAGLGF